MKKLYRVARHFCRSLFLQLAIFCVLRELIFAIRTDLFFLLGIKLCTFQNFPDKSLIIFSFLLNKCNGNRYFKQYYGAHPTLCVKPVTVLFLNERDKLYSN